MTVETKKGRERAHDRVQGGSAQKKAWCSAVYGSNGNLSQPHELTKYLKSKVSNSNLL